MFDLITLGNILLFFILFSILIIYLIKNKYLKIKGIIVLILFILAIIFFVIGAETLGDTNFYLNISAIFLWTGIFVLIYTFIINIYFKIKDKKLNSEKKTK